MVIHGLPECSETLPTIKLADDAKSLTDIFWHLPLSLPPEPKLFILGGRNAKKPRPPKVIFVSKELAIKFISGFNAGKRS